MLRFRKMTIFFRNVGKTLAGVWAMFGFGAILVHYFEWSVGVIAGSAIFLLATITGAISGWREFQTECHLAELRHLGRAAARIGRPPDFFRKDGIEADVADELAIM